MSVTLPIRLAVAPLLLGALVACGSSSGSSSTPSVKAAALAYQAALINDDPAGACVYIDATALKAQIAKAGAALAGKDCTSLLTTVLTLAKSTGQPIRPAKDIRVTSQAGDTATVQTTNASGQVQVSTWKLKDGGWKVAASGLGK